MITGLWMRKQDFSEQNPKAGLGSTEIQLMYSITEDTSKKKKSKQNKSQ